VTGEPRFERAESAFGDARFDSRSGRKVNPHGIAQRVAKSDAIELGAFSPRGVADDQLRALPAWIAIDFGHAL
jgi:hypothetical protein